MDSSIIYLDNNSTTRVDDRVIDAMIPYFKEFYGNASSSHALGINANEAVTHSRSIIAELLHCSEREIYFTSGATESINLALKGIANQTKTRPLHIITAKTEHPAVLDTSKFLEKSGVEVTYLDVSAEGVINLNELEQQIRTHTALICLMYVNNETGVIQPVEEVGEIAHKHNILFMCDATQAVGKIPIDVYKQNIDILCFSGHKFYGPKGIGGIFIRAKRPFKAQLEPLLHGGGHEKNMRSGTLNVGGIVGIGKAAEIALQEMTQNIKNIDDLRKKLEESILEIPRTQLNGSAKDRIFNTCNIRFEGVDADAIISGLKNIAVSNGSACSSQSIDPSHVLIAMGLTERQAFSSIRFSLGKYNTESQIFETINVFKNVIKNLRSFSTSVYE